MREKTAGRLIGLYAIVCLVLFAPCDEARAENDSLNLAESYINLALTANYYDTLSSTRISNITTFIQSRLQQITAKPFIAGNRTLYHFTYAYLYFVKAKFLFYTQNDFTRPFLLKCKRTLDSSIDHINDAGLRIDQMISYEVNDPFYILAGFTRESCESLVSSVESLKDKLNPYFNSNIYGDFKRIFYAAKNNNVFYFDSLRHFASLFDMPIDFSILDNTRYATPHRRYDDETFFVDRNFTLTLPLDLISEYLQFSYLAGKQSSVRDLYALYDSYNSFKRRLNYGSKDDFFRQELNNAVLETLYQQLQQKFPYSYEPELPLMMSRGPTIYKDQPAKYYFPIPAPFPSSFISINHFRPDLQTMQQVSMYIQNCFDSAGYNYRLHYYYTKYPGFAVTTDLERIDKKGAPVKDKRWDLKMSDDGKFSLYQIFRAIFFATESDYRMIACIIAPQEISISPHHASIQEMSHLINQGYKSLPVDLENVELSDKTLTVLVYHFYQSDVGEVPVLSVNDNVIVPDHLKNTTPLQRLINSR